MRADDSNLHRVLLIEDNTADAHMVRERLKDATGLSPFHITHAHNLTEGITFLKSESFHVLLLDLNLPEVNGLETVERIRSVNSTTPLVILTAIEDEPLTLEAIKLGVQDYIPKSQMHSALLCRILSYAMERDRNERKRQESESKYRMFVEGAVGLAFILLDLEGHITHWNSGAERLFGYAEKAVVGKYFALLFTPEDQENGRPEKELRYAERSEKGDDDHWVVRADGTRFWASGAVTAVRNAQNQLIGYAKVIRDQTIQKETRDQLAELNKTLEERVKKRTQELLHHKNRLRAMATELNLAEQRERRHLASDLHDYLAQLLVVCRMKLTHTQSLSVPQALSQILQEVDSLLDQSITYTRTLVSQLSPSCLYEMGLPAALVWLGTDMKNHGLTVTVSGADRTFQIPEDQSVLIYQCVRELLFNVLKHSGVNEATVTLSSEADTQLQIHVEDGGRGITEATKNQPDSASDKFGLFSIRERVEALGGKMELTSIPTKGTHVALTVPLKDRVEKNL
ncbi:MAG: PAS domain S-box protein [Nitrospirales bacterium]